MDYAVEINKLTKNYKKIKALDEISLQVPPGKIYGLIGPNGAGKTTLIRSIIGTTKPTGGTISVMGIDPVSDRYVLRKLIGYMPQDPSLYEDLTARGNVAFFANAAGIKNAGKRITEVLELVELSHRSINSVHTFSGGMKKRVSLACALVHEPKILFLDEPTSAIDPKLKQKLWQLFRKLADKGITLFISTNMIEEAMYCDQVAILREGKLLLVASPEKLKKKGSAVINITFKDGKVLKEKIANNPEEIAKLLKRHGLKSDVETVEIAPDSLDKILLNLIGNEK